MVDYKGLTALSAMDDASDALQPVLEQDAAPPAPQSRHRSVALALSALILLFVGAAGAGSVWYSQGDTLVRADAEAAIMDVLHPVPGGTVLTQLQLGHDTSLCFDITEGEADEWTCHPIAEDQAFSTCTAWRRDHMENRDYRYGWELLPIKKNFHSPCGCSCCRRWLKGRPEEGGGLNLKVQPCVDGKASQLFLIPQSDVGPIRLANHNTTCVTVTGPGWEYWPKDGKVYGDGVKLWLWECGKNSWSGQLWKFPKDTTGPVVCAQNQSQCLDANRLYSDHTDAGSPGTSEHLLQIWGCDSGSARGPDQLFVMPGWNPAKSNNPPSQEVTRPRQVELQAATCGEDQWPQPHHRCSACTVTVREEIARTCSSFCQSVRRECGSAHKVAGTDQCNPGTPSSCNELIDGKSMCRCGPHFVSGNYGSLAEFWLSEDAMRQKVRDMVDKFGILEFRFYAAFEGFSKPPVNKTTWHCKLQNREVIRSAVQAAVDEVTELGGRTWFGVHGSAVDVNDEAMSKGQWVMPAQDVATKVDRVFFQVMADAEVEEGRRLGRASNTANENSYQMSYQEMCGCDVGAAGINGKADPDKRVMDMVNMNPAWAHRFVPAWADFVAGLKMSGIHWESFGDFGTPRKSSGPVNPFGEGAPEPDIVGFLRAAKGILTKRGLSQTMTFVDGYGFDQALLLEQRAQGRILSYPIWEAWGPESEESCFRELEGFHFILDEYPGFSKYHCCAKNERQNAAEYGVWPYDVALKRQRKVLERGGKYHLIVDGNRYVQGPYIPDAVFLSRDEEQKLQSVLFPSSQGEIHSAYMYGVSPENKVVRQSLMDMTPESEWTPVSAAGVVSIVVSDRTVYGINTKGFIVMQRLATMTQQSHWGVFNKGDFTSIAISGETMYCTTKKNHIVKFEMGKADENTVNFEFVAADDIGSLYFSGDDVFAVKAGNLVRKGAGQIIEEGKWQAASNKGMLSMAVFGDRIYAVDDDHKIMKQRLSTMTEESKWEPASKEGVKAIALEILLS